FLVGDRRPRSQHPEAGPLRPCRPRQGQVEAAGRRLMPGPIRLGVAPIAWSNSDLPQLGGETTLETCLKESRRAGFSGTETGVKFPMDAGFLGPILQKHRLALVSGWFSGELLRKTVKAEQARILAQME